MPELLGEGGRTSVTLYLQLFRWSLHWQLGGFDGLRCRSTLVKLMIRKGLRDWHGWLIAWDEKPDWKHLPTNGALRVEITRRGETRAYVFRGPIELVSVS